MKQVLITGVSGFAGSHLAEYLVGLGTYKVAGTYLSESSLKNVTHLKNKITLVKVNLVDRDATHSVIASIRPQLVFHLAALPAVRESYLKPAEVIVNNVTAQINVLE